MRKSHDRRPARGVAEPVQVYLDRSDQTRLDRLTTLLGASKSEVLRRALAALEHQLTDPAEHPALRIIGIAGTAPPHPGPRYDVAVEHDRFFVDSEAASWRPARKPRRGR